MKDSPEVRPLPSVTGAVRATVTVPGSKSLTNRALIVAALAEGRSRITGALFSDDTRYMAEALRQAGVGVEEDAERSELTVVGLGRGPEPVEKPLFLGNAGTAMRFLTAYFALGHGVFTLDGVERMRERPIAELIDALNRIGGNVRSERGTGCPPVIVEASGLEGGATWISGKRSSQFLSAILMSAPYFRRGVEIEIPDELASEPYLDLTGDVMAAFGVTLENEFHRRFKVSPGKYNAMTYAVEADASTASYFLAAAAVTGGRVTVRGLSRQSHQGDIEFVKLLESAGCGVAESAAGLTVEGSERLTGLDMDMNRCSDMALTLAAVAPFCETPTSIRNVAHIRVQETDRINAMCTELRRAGIQVDERADGLTVYPGKVLPTRFQSYDDHRVAMSLALIGLRTPGCSVENPACVRKTFPGFWDAWERMIAGERYLPRSD